MFELSVTKEFTASHRIEGLEDTHSHTWLVTICGRYERLDKHGMAIDFHKMGTILAEVTDQLNGKDLNDTIDIPSSEKIGQFIFNRVKEKIPELIWVEVQEGSYGRVRYTPP